MTGIAPALSVKSLTHNEAHKCRFGRSKRWQGSNTVPAITVGATKEEHCS